MKPDNNGTWVGVAIVIGILGVLLLGFIFQSS